jgi:ABC-type uncharacterized transport system YnjBCD permease subunit
MNRFWGIPFLSFHLSNLITSIKTALHLAAGSINEPAMPLLHTTRLPLPARLHLPAWYVG